MPKSPSPSETVQAFFAIAQEKLNDVMKNGRHKAAWSDGSARSKEYESELNILKPHYKPFIWGVCTTVALFASFRISKFTGALNKAKTGAYQFENLQKKPKQQASDALSIPIDILLSLLVGTSTALFLTDEVKMQNDLANIPLVKGRSLVSEELCSDFIREYNRLPKQSWSSGKNDAENRSLNAIGNFVGNCQKRNRLVLHRQNDGLESEEARKIPDPGVLQNLSDITSEEASLNDE